MITMVLPFAMVLRWYYDQRDHGTMTTTGRPVDHLLDTFQMLASTKLQSITINYIAIQKTTGINKKIRVQVDIAQIAIWRYDVFWIQMVVCILVMFFALAYMFLRAWHSSIGAGGQGGGLGGGQVGRPGHVVWDGRGGGERMYVVPRVRWYVVYLCHPDDL